MQNLYFRLDEWSEQVREYRPSPETFKTTLERPKLGHHCHERLPEHSKVVQFDSEPELVFQKSDWCLQISEGN